MQRIHLEVDILRLHTCIDSCLLAGGYCCEAGLRRSYRVCHTSRDVIDLVVEPVVIGPCLDCPGSPSLNCVAGAVLQSNNYPAQTVTVAGSGNKTRNRTWSNLAKLYRIRQG